MFLGVARVVVGWLLFFGVGIQQCLSSQSFLRDRSKGDTRLTHASEPKGMASPTNTEVAEDFIKSVLKTLDYDEGKLKEDVEELCKKVLIPICKECRDIAQKEEIVPERLELLRRNFMDIYWTLKLHLVFYLGLETANKEKKLHKLGQLLEIPEEELSKTFPGKESAIDPGSKLLEIVSTSSLFKSAQRKFSVLLITFNRNELWIKTHIRSFASENALNCCCQY